MPDKPVVLLTNPMHPDGEALLAPHVRMITAPDAQPDTLRKWAAEADGIVVRAKLPDDIVDHAPRLKAIVRHGVGLDFIPVTAATARGIAVANLPGSNTNAVAEYVMSALMHLRRPLQKIDTQLRAEGWLAARAAACDVRTTLEIWPEMVHVFAMFGFALSEGRQVVEDCGAFVRSHFRK